MKRNIFAYTNGEQVPGCQLKTEEKVIIARELEALGVDVIEAGFAAASPGDVEAIQAICKSVKTPIIWCMHLSSALVMKQERLRPILPRFAHRPVCGYELVAQTTRRVGYRVEPVSRYHGACRIQPRTHASFAKRRA